MKQYMISGETTITFGEKRKAIVMHRNGGLIPVFLTVKEKKIGNDKIFTAILHRV